MLVTDTPLTEIRRWPTLIRPSASAGPGRALRPLPRSASLAPKPVTVMGQLLDARDLHVTLGTETVLRGASLTLDEGGHALVLGPSGAGKTTLLNVIARLVTPDEGTLTFRGKDITAWGSPTRFRRQHVGFLFQDFHLLEVKETETGLSASAQIDAVEEQAHRLLKGLVRAN